jgi:hypothetical protein
VLVKMKRCNVLQQAYKGHGPEDDSRLAGSCEQHSGLILEEKMWILGWYVSQGMSEWREKVLEHGQKVISGLEEEQRGPLIGSDERGSYLLWR